MKTIESLVNTVTNQAKRILELTQMIVDRDDKNRALEDENADLRRQLIEQK